MVFCGKGTLPVWLGGLAGPGALPFRRLFLFLGPVLGPPHWQQLELANEPLMVTCWQVCPVQAYESLVAVHSVKAYLQALVHYLSGGISSFWGKFFVLHTSLPPGSTPGFWRGPI